MFVRAEVMRNGMESTARVGDGFLANPRVVSDGATGSTTINTSKILGGVIKYAALAGVATLTTDTAALLAAAMPDMDIGDCYMFVVINPTANAATIAGGTGVTASGNTTVTSGARMCFLEKTGAATFALHCA